jgi:uncharacterized protein YwgA
LGNKDKLKKFIYLLKNEIGFDFNINEFDDRIKLQKYVFISKYFGYDHDYNFNIYLRGPYSSDLAEDYYNISDNKNNEEIIPDLDIDTKSFKKLVDDKQIEWLESATTMLSIYSTYYSKDEVEKDKVEGERLIRDTQTIKEKINGNVIKHVFNDLKNQHVFN